MRILGNRSIYVLLCLSLISLTADSCNTAGRKTGKPVVEKRFKSWLEHYNKHYKDKDEWMLRFGIYQANLDFIDFFNAKNLSYQLGDNEFADLTNEEFKEMYVGHLNLPNMTIHTSNSTTSMSSSPLEAPLGPAPPAVDWRTKGALNAIKNQGQCGSCWAFSTCASIEAITQIKTGKLVSLSEQELVDCDTMGQNKGCRGGLMEEAFKFVKANAGLATEQEYPYKGTQGSCQKIPKKAATISGYKTVPPNSEKDLLAAVAQQPVSVALESSGSPFQLYKTGIFKGDCGTRVNHAVNLVGYGEEKGAKYWIVRNSWGTSWGEQGYMKLVREAGEPAGACGIATMPSYPLA